MTKIEQASWAITMFMIWCCLSLSWLLHSWMWLTHSPQTQTAQKLDRTRSSHSHCCIWAEHSHRPYLAPGVLLQAASAAGSQFRTLSEKSDYLPLKFLPPSHAQQLSKWKCAGINRNDSQHVFLFAPTGFFLCRKTSASFGWASEN